MPSTGAMRAPKSSTQEDERLLPGFIDSHFHLLWGSLKLEQLQLYAANDMDASGVIDPILRCGTSRKEWIEGVQLRTARFHRMARLDRSFPGRPRA